MALGYAAIALVILAIFLPVAMIKKARKEDTYQGLYQVKGGNLSLSLAAGSGLIIISAQCLITAGMLPALG